MTESRANVSVQQLSLVQSIVLHLLPGVLILVFFVIAAPLAESLGAPSFLALILAIAFVLIPFELGYLLYQGQKENGRLSLTGVVLYREPVPWWQYIVLVIPLVAWGALFFMIVAPPIDNFFIEALFSWLPDWFFLDGFMSHMDQYSRPILILTGILTVILNGIAGPLVEELYFRGYLLPRISRLGGWAPAINTVLFSLYHFFTPWQNLIRIVVLVPMCYIVWWKKNIYIGIIVHCAMNTFTSLMLLALILVST